MLEHTPANDRLWQGRSDPEDGPTARRWHHAMQCWPAQIPPDAPPGTALIGFASSLGAVRNKGRHGAEAGPEALRKALANQAWHATGPLYDAGDIHPLGRGARRIQLPPGTAPTAASSSSAQATDELAAAQDLLASKVASLRRAGHLPVVLGGDHSVAWGTWQGLAQAHPDSTIAVVNLDAHLDLRKPPRPGWGTSGTPFFQVAQAAGSRFRYACLGVAATSNTAALFDRAADLGAHVVSDHAVVTDTSTEIDRLLAYLHDADHIHLTVCLDALPAAVAPGVSAPAPYGVPMAVLVQVMRAVKATGKVAALEIAELAPCWDQDHRTAKVGARLLFEGVG